jgi:hypothetical protein
VFKKRVPKNIFGPEETEASMTKKTFVLHVKYYEGSQMKVDEAYDG